MSFFKKNLPATKWPLWGYKLPANYGFTLTELMVVIAIIGIFSSLTIINLRGGENARELENQALLLLDGVKRIQTAALAGQLVDGQVPMAYRLTISSCASGCSYDLTATTIIDSADIKLGIGLANVAVDLVNEAGQVVATDLVVEIMPPRGKMMIYLDGAAPADNQAIIRLRHTTDTALEKIIRLNSLSGRTDIE